MSASGPGPARLLEKTSGAALGAAAAVRDRLLGGGKPRQVGQVMTVAKSLEDAYAFWRDLANLPRFMTHLQRVDVTDERHSHWVANGPGGTTVEWDAEIITDEPARRLAWRSVEGTPVPNEGAVSFTPAPGGRGTEVRVDTAYLPPAGAVGVAVAKVAGAEPAQQIRADLRRFKAVLETGEYLRLDDRVSGRGAAGGRLLHAVGERLRMGGALT